VQRSDDFEAFVHQHGQALVWFARRLTTDHHRGEDLVQEVLARCAFRWNEIEHIANRPAYVRKAIVREYLSWRRRRSSTEWIVAEVGESPSERAGAFDGELAARDEMIRALAQLPARQRVVLVLRYYEDLPDERIAEILRSPASTVRSLARRGLISLRHCTPAADILPMRS
jgi:RNA polymerase sigma-70 factor (sigma-E family)